MNTSKIILFTLFIIIISVVRLGIDLPFCGGKYIYWIFGVIIFGLFFVIKESRKQYIITSLDFYAIILFSIGFINFNYISKSTVYNINIWYYWGYLILYFLFRQYLSNKSTIEKSLTAFIYFIIITAMLNSAVAILQFYGIDQSPNMYFKITGFFFSPNQLGIYLALGILSTLSLLRSKKSKKATVIIYTGLGILLFSLVLTESRGAIISLVFAILFMFFDKKQLKNKNNQKIAISSLIVLLTIFAAFSNYNSKKSNSTSGRLFILRQSADQIREHPLFGYGIDSFSLEYNLQKAKYFSIERSWNDVKNASYIYNANNDLLELTFELGLVWMSIFIIFIIKIIVMSSKGFETRTCGSVVLCLLIFSTTNTILPVPMLSIIGCYSVVVIINLHESKSIFNFDKNVFTQIGLIGIMILFLGIISLRLNAESKLFDLYKGTKHFTGIKRIEMYLSKIDSKGDELFMGGGILHKNEFEKQAVTYLERGFERSGKPSLGKILGKIYMTRGEFGKAEEIFEYNINVEPFRFDGRMDLFHLYIFTKQDQKAKYLARKINELPIKIPSNKATKYKNEVIKYLNKSNKKSTY